MIRVCVEVREGTDRFEVEACADSISQAVGLTKQRFPGGDVQVVFPIHGDEFFGGRGTSGGETMGGEPAKLLAARVP